MTLDFFAHKKTALRNYFVLSHNRHLAEPKQIRKNVSTVLFSLKKEND